MELPEIRNGFTLCDWVLSPCCLVLLLDQDLVDDMALLHPDFEDFLGERGLGGLFLLIRKQKRRIVRVLYGPIVG